MDVELVGSCEAYKIWYWVIQQVRLQLAYSCNPLPLLRRDFGICEYLTAYS